MKIELSHAADKKPKKTIEVSSLEDLLKICQHFDRDIILSLPMKGTKSKFDFYVMVYDDKIE